MPSYHSDSEGVAVATAPVKPILTPPKLSPLAGLIASPPTSKAPTDQEVPTHFIPTPSAQLPAAAPAPAMRTTVYAAEKRPSSPWSKPSASLAAQQTVTPRDTPGAPQPLPKVDDGIDGVRELLFGTSFNEIRTKVAELQLSLNGEIKRLREATMNRVDEMASALHRDMICLRAETQEQINQLKTDVFTAATTISSVKDQMHAADERSRSDLSHAVADIYSRVAEKETHLFTAMEHLQTQMSRTLDTALAGAFIGVAQKADVANAIHQASLLVAGPDLPDHQDSFGMAAGNLDADALLETGPDDSFQSDATDWFRIPDPSMPDPAVFR